MLTAQAHSKEEGTRQEAVAALEALAARCSDSAAVERLLARLVAVLDGADGKLTVADQKMAVLKVRSLQLSHVWSGQGAVTNRTKLG